MYKRLAMQFHPDRNSGNKWAEEIFKDINKDYHILSHPFPTAKSGFISMLSMRTKLSASQREFNKIQLDMFALIKGVFLKVRKIPLI